MLLVAPWTGFWEHNLFVLALPSSATVLLSPWVRGALSGVGVVTLIAGLIDLLAIFLRTEPSGPRSAQARH